MKKQAIILSVFWSALGVCANCPMADLRGFHEDPKSFLEAHPRKFDKNCNPVKFTLFDGNSIADKSFVVKKDSKRKELCHSDQKGARKVCLENIAPGQNVLAGRAPIESLDRAENMVPPQELLTTLESMEELKLKEGSVATQPWSDWYWPIAVGQLSYRYNDPEMMNELSMNNLDENNMWTWVNNWHADNKSMPADVNALSPSEKYDLLMGDTNYTLTKKMLNAGAYYQNNFGKVETWMGLCHGWAPASYMLPRPVKTITVETPDGGELSFLPTDLKALGTLLWASGKQQNKFIGGRCNKKHPRKDKVTGKILDSECFDTNPGSWHMAVVSHVGKMKKPFVMDATFDYEVWNHPVTGYSYKYFNPVTMESVDSLAEAKVAVEDFFNDKFSKYRGQEARYVVGVSMKVDYLVETMPSTSGANQEWEDAFHHVQYNYDLELDADGNIVGGEWYTNAHPDFLWTPYEGSKANSVVDDYIQMDQLPLDMIGDPRLLDMAPYASEQGQPVGRVVEALLRAAGN